METYTAAAAVRHQLEARMWAAEARHGLVMMNIAGEGTRLHRRARLYAEHAQREAAAAHAAARNILDTTES